jgi:hypothetical protein
MDSLGFYAPNSCPVFITSHFVRNKSSKDMAFPGPPRVRHNIGLALAAHSDVGHREAMRAGSLDSQLLSRLRRPGGRFNAELFCVFRVQPLPAGELHRLSTGDAADGSSAEKAIQNIQRNVPPGSPH